MSVTLLISVRAHGHDLPPCQTLSVSVTMSMSVTEFVFVTVSVYLLCCPFLLSFQSRPVSVFCDGGCDHIIELVTVRVPACTFSVVVSMHDHVDVRLSVDVHFRVCDHVSVCPLSCPIYGHVWCPLSFLRLCWWPCPCPCPSSCP